LKCVGPAVFLVEEWNAVAWALPNGPMLRAAKVLLDRRKFARFLAEAGLPGLPGGRMPRAPKLIRYVPRRRAVFRAQKALGRPYVKLYAPGRDQSAARNLALAADAASGAGAFAVPRLLAHVARRRALVMAEVPGRRLSDLEGSDLAAFASAGRALAALHRSPIVPKASWSPDRELRALRAATRDLGIALPALRPRLDAAVARIERVRATLRFPSDRPIHGNMFGDQLLVSDDGEVSIVDWDDLCCGDPLFDVGRLAAHLHFVGRHESASEALIGAHARGAPAVWLDAPRLAWHVATAILLRAKISALRTLPPSWIADVERSLALAERVLDETARFVALEARAPAREGAR
jgi:aminoglycoside phosphotransferase (APT) family kinase protein